MILKIGRNSNDAHGNNETPYQNYTWEYIEKVQNVVAKRYETPTLEQSTMDVTDVMYITETDKWEVVEGLAHSTTLSGSDVCYLMNDEGKTIERLR